ncbi:MAG: transglutaminase-like domain-containing protein, partial [bacterium]|nr:transglutaminase-like domain-containing protein [bacterium]
IRAIADSIAAGGETGMDLAVELAEWVNRYIAEKTFSQGFGSALDVLYSREGDCTEHSVLLASVLRASDLPARVASGLAYSNGQLVGHMWTEVYVDRWVTLDALDLSTAPIRIRLSVSRNQRALGETDTANAYSLVAGMKAFVRSHRPRPQ